MHATVYPSGKTQALWQASLHNCMGRIRQLAEGKEVVMTHQADFKYDMHKERGWTLVEDTREPAEIAIGNLELVTLFKQDETYVMGAEMRKRAKNIGANLGQRHAEYLLYHQDEIPEEWRGNYLVFPGTVWRGGRRRYVPNLYWRDNIWILYLHQLDVWLNSDGRVLRLSK